MSTELNQRIFKITENAYNLQAQLDDLQAVKTALVHTLEDVQTANKSGVNCGVNTEMQLRVAYLALNALTKELEPQIKSLDTNAGIANIIVNSPRIVEFLEFENKEARKKI